MNRWAATSAGRPEPADAIVHPRRDDHPRCDPSTTSLTLRSRSPPTTERSPVSTWRESGPGRRSPCTGWTRHRRAARPAAVGGGGRGRPGGPSTADPRAGRRRVRCRTGTESSAQEQTAARRITPCPAERGPARQRPGQVAGGPAPDRRDQRPGVPGGRPAPPARPADGPADRRAEARGPAGGRPGRSTSTTTSAAGGRTSTPRSEHCLRGRRAGASRVVELLRPDEDDYFVLKPKHSGLLLDHAGHPAGVPGGPDRGPDRRSRRTSACCSRPTTPTCGTCAWWCRPTAWPRTPRRRTGTPWTRCGKVLKADTRPSTELSFEALGRN